MKAKIQPYSGCLNNKGATNLIGLGCSIWEFQLLLQGANSVHYLGLSHACPSPLSCVQLPQNHSKCIDIHSMTQSTCSIERVSRKTSCTCQQYMHYAYCSHVSM